MSRTQKAIWIVGWLLAWALLTYAGSGMVLMGVSMSLSGPKAQVLPDQDHKGPADGGDTGRAKEKPDEREKRGDLEPPEEDRQGGVDPGEKKRKEEAEKAEQEWREALEMAEALAKAIREMEEGAKQPKSAKEYAGPADQQRESKKERTKKEPAEKAEPERREAAPRAEREGEEAANKEAKEKKTDPAKGLTKQQEAARRLTAEDLSKMTFAGIKDLLGEPTEVAPSAKRRNVGAAIWKTGDGTEVRVNFGETQRRRTKTEKVSMSGSPL
jgi:hypothetical protein